MSCFPQPRSLSMNKHSSCSDNGSDDRKYLLKGLCVASAVFGKFIKLTSTLTHAFSPSWMRNGKMSHSSRVRKTKRQKWYVSLSSLPRMHWPDWDVKLIVSSPGCEVMSKSTECAFYGTHLTRLLCMTYGVCALFCTKRRTQSLLPYIVDEIYRKEDIIGK